MKYLLKISIKCPKIEISFDARKTSKKSLGLSEGVFFANRLFVCQDEDENEHEDEFFRSFRIKTVTNESGPQYYDTLKDRFLRHAQVPERTKALVFVFVFVFVLAHEQAINEKLCDSTFSVNPMYSVNFMSVKVMLHCTYKR